MLPDNFRLTARKQELSKSEECYASSDNNGFRRGALELLFHCLRMKQQIIHRYYMISCYRGINRVFKENKQFVQITPSKIIGYICPPTTPSSPLHLDF